MKTTKEQAKYLIIRIHKFGPTKEGQRKKRGKKQENKETRREGDKETKTKKLTKSLTINYHQANIIILYSFKLPNKNKMI